MQLLQDTFIIEQLQVINEGKAAGPMKIRGVFGRCNEKNNNGRIYPTAVLESQLEKVKPLILERRLCGELDHPQNDTVKLSNASHLVTKLEMKGDDLIGEAEILKTPAGLTAKALVEGGVKIGISSRGMGTLSEDHNGDKIVNEDFRLVTFDLVADPSTRGAFPGLSESTESQFVRESQSKLKKESNFVTMLESKMRDAYDPWIEEAKTKKKLTKKQREKMDVEPKGGDGDIDSKDLVKLRAGHDKFEEAMELVKADGHWHRIAEAILEAFDDGAKGSSDQQQIALLRRIRREQVKGKLVKGVDTAATREKTKVVKKSAKRGGRRKSDTRTSSGRRGRTDEDSGSSYKQFGTLFMEAAKGSEETKFDATPQAKAKRGIAGMPSHEPEGTFSRISRHSAEQRHARKMPVAVAKGEADAKTAGKIATAKGLTKSSRIEKQQVRRRAFEKERGKAAPEGSIGSIGLGGKLRAAGADAVKGVGKLRGKLSRVGFRGTRHEVGDSKEKDLPNLPVKPKEATSYKQLGFVLAEMLKN